jgi:hypothetical protein
VLRREADGWERGRLDIVLLRVWHMRLNEVTGESVYGRLSVRDGVCVVCCGHDSGEARLEKTPAAKRAWRSDIFTAWDFERASPLTQALLPEPNLGLLGAMATTRQAVRRWILTLGFTAVTATGAIYGATLKEDVEVKKVHSHAFFLFTCLQHPSELSSLSPRSREPQHLLTFPVSIAKEARPTSHPGRTY